VLQSCSTKGKAFFRDRAFVGAGFSALDAPYDSYFCFRASVGEALREGDGLFVPHTSTLHFIVFALRLALE
jgi:hypothetical protein